LTIIIYNNRRLHCNLVFAGNLEPFYRSGH